ncbi:gluconate kinase, SKI family [Aliiroseovarius halocynthiae]|uniref:Gluconokinase n=1 Tax=Aliiroseovarius halocynthiae TaxID=985055 RepID=A0A545SUJ2_9RHOB|nr:gluconokinase [Aliiroseovarius halocynthiae]TQV68635.1 gluconokinase [Aliiroseovarius halocynthiae]SMR71053.1 gluconate kinase, SKI family [Aliiroseovarius halocynthiae]
MQKKVIVVMGVSGVGKTSVALGIARQLGAIYVEADDFHPQKNVDAMRAGIPLTDEMRHPWLTALAEGIADTQAAQDGQVVVAACSALKKSYRDTLRDRLPDVFFVHLHGDQHKIEGRMSARTDHFMPSSLLDSQFATLEPPNRDEASCTVDVSGSKSETIDKALRLLPEEFLC